ncbi:MAG: exodeoxyribonuclease III [Fimbriimonadaceae bacterium]
MRIATFNVNSVRARLPILERWLAEAEPDVVALQEVKVEDGLFPREPIEALGYHCAVYGQKAYHGVGLLAKKPIEIVEAGLTGDGMLDDKRVLHCVVDGVAIVNTYVPNGTRVGTDKFSYKLAWLERFKEVLEERYRPEDRVVWLGDINIAPSEDDVYEPDRHVGSVGFHPEEKSRLRAILEGGWTDCFRKFTQGEGHYTFWEYMIPNGFKRNLGWRIDHVYASPGIVGACTDCAVDKEPRTWERPSDHTPVVATFNLE